ncbi:hypothetical protein [Brevundimonas sp. NIBR11]|uniref:hypothetical protein n=1 Tax=Brevundimonas sp. NIBR11 TaxID=3015999 RepID=UPI0022F04614|nr:hypothetical protein [Brevundimonas sp. NIBR11]WGM30491.1 hypothetical protein KKHFBJBL_00715 [Brevundimonas sp. NIBR11]
MTYFCFIELAGSSTPHMEPLDVASVEDAKAQAQRLLRDHASARAARIYLDEKEVAMLGREGDRS